MASGGDTSEAAYQRAWAERTEAAARGVAQPGFGREGAPELSPFAPARAALDRAEGQARIFAEGLPSPDDVASAGRWFTIALVAIAVIVVVALLFYFGAPFRALIPRGRA